MIKLSNVNLGLRKLFTSAAIILLMAPVAGCGKNIKESTLTDTVKYLSEADTANAEDILVDDYINSICEREETSVEKLEIALQTAYISGDKKAMNDCIAKLSEVILKSLVAEGLKVPEEELKDFKITGYETIHRGFDKDTKEGSYGVKFKLYDRDYHLLMKSGTSEDLAYYYRAGKKEEITFDNSQATYAGAKSTMDEALTSVLILNPKGVIKELSEPDTSLTGNVTYDGQVYAVTSKEKVRAIKRGQKQK